MHLPEFSIFGIYFWFSQLYFEHNVKASVSSICYQR